MTQMVRMYHPLIPSTTATPVQVSPQAVDDYAARGWLEVDPGSPPVVIAPYLTQAAGDSRYLPVWRPVTPVLAGQVWMAPDGQQIQRTSDGTTRAAYDATEQAAWSLPLRAALVPKWKPNTAYASGEFVLNPSGQIAQANADFTSGTSYNATNWTVVSGGGGTDATKAALTDLGMTAGHGVGAVRDIYARRDQRPVPPAVSRLISGFQAGHGWALQGGSPGTVTDDTSVFMAGSQSVAVSTTGSQGSASSTVFGVTGLAAMDLTRFDLRLKLRLDNPAQLANFTLKVRAGSDVTANYAERRFGPLSSFVTVGGAGQFSQLSTDGEWQTYTLSMAYRPNGNVGSPNLAKVTALGLAFADTASGTPATVHIQEVALIPKASNAYPHGVVSFTWDDGYVEQFNTVKPYLDKYGMPATAFVIRDVIGSTPGTYMSLAQLQQLEADGWEVACHANTQANHDVIGGYNSLTAQQLDDEFANQKAWMLANGFRGSDYSAYPQGRNNAAVVAAASRYFTSMRTTAAYDGLETVPPADPMRVRCITLSDTSGISLAQYKTIIDNAYDQGGWVIFYCHKVTASPSGVQVSPAIFQGVVDYIAAKGVPVRPYGDVIRAGTAAVAANVLPPAGVANPADYGVTGWSMDPAFAAAGVALTAAGTARGVRIQDTPGAIRSTIAMMVTTAGVGLANTYVAVYDSAGNQLGVSADMSTTFQAAGAKRVAMGSSFTVPADGVLVAILLCGTASTLPAISGANVGNTLNFDFPGTGKSNARSFTTGSGLSAAPATLSLQSVTASNNLPWMASNV